jgi:hypothetical protein
VGTSRPKPDAPPASPLIPPWADRDPVPPVPPPDPSEEEPGPPADEVVDGEDDSDVAEIAEPRRFAGFRSGLSRFAGSGDRDDARTALGHWARKSVGGGSAGSRRTARAARSGGAVLADLARAAADQPPEAGALDIRTLTGQPIEAAVGAIIDAFMPPGILDEMAARLAMEQALAVALGSTGTFDPASIDSNAVRIATLAFVGELVFVQVAGDAGRSLASIGPVAAAQREADIRSLVHAVVDLVGSPVLQAEGDILSEQRMATLVSQLVREA